MAPFLENYGVHLLTSALSAYVETEWLKHSLITASAQKVSTRVSQEHLDKKLRFEGEYWRATGDEEEASQQLITHIFCSIETGLLIEPTSCKQLRVMP